MSRSSATILDAEAVAQEYPDIYNSLIPLLKRSEPGSLDAYLEVVACDAKIQDTKTQAHCYFIALDGNRRPRVKDFARFIGKRITDFSIPRAEITRALNESVRKGSAAPMDTLNAKARSLFSRLPNSGEGGEVILSVLAETFLRIPQLFTKMVMKTNPEMHVHGSDGIHVGVNQESGNLAVYWGESKLYQDAASAVNKCFSSLSRFLLDAGGSSAAQERDIQLMRDGLSLDDADLLVALKRYLNPDDPLFNKLEYRGLCLIGFDSGCYPTSPNTKETQELKKEIEVAFDKNKKQILNRVTAEQINSFVIEVFCLPFPSVDAFRGAFRAELGLST
ncbi:MAG: HamA C-terminal domain-containing protein [Armatimonadota bacterium]